MTGDRPKRHVPLEGPHVPAYPVQEVDPTGAGDVFTAAFLIRYHQEHDLRGAARFAAATASFVVEGPGARALPTRAQVDARMERHQPAARAP